jgi:hypothetical protein
MRQKHGRQKTQSYVWSFCRDKCMGQSTVFLGKMCYYFQKFRNFLEIILKILAITFASYK